MNSWTSDVRYVLRVLWRHRALNAIALATLALAIGANTAIFSVVNALLIRPLPYPEPERLVQVVRQYPGGVGDYTSVPKFLVWKAQTGSALASIAAYDALGSGFNLTGGTPERVVGSRVSAAFFATLGVRPYLGRDFREEEDRPNQNKVVLLSHALWEHRFGARKDLVGQTLTLNDEPYAVIGVMPKGFAFPDKAALWTLQQFDPGSRDQSNNFQVIGRRRAGLSEAQARANLQVVADQIRKAEPGLMEKTESLGVRPLREALYGDMRQALLILLAAVGLVLVIACVNVANLQIAQAAARQRDIALRTALGADAWRIVRLLMLESVILALLGGLAGLALSYVAIPLFGAVSPDDAYHLEGVDLDGRVLLFTLAVSLLAGMLFGLLPAWQSRRPDVEAVLRDSGSRSTGGRAGARTRHVLVAGEVALALMLTVAAAMLVKSLIGLQQRDPGFRAEHVLTMKLSLPERKYGTPEKLGQFQEQLEARLHAVPGVRSASLMGSLPLELGPELPIEIEGRWVPGTETGLFNASVRLTGVHYFDTLQIPLRSGRRFDARDRQGSLPVIIINETIARKHWPNESPIGKRVTLAQSMRTDLAETIPREIIGVVGNVREETFSAAPPPVVYLPMAQASAAFTGILVRVLPFAVAVRTDGAPGALAQATQRAIWEVDPNQPVTNVLLMDEIVARSLGFHRFNTLLLSLLAALALLLAAVGLYGVLSHLVGQRVREVGLRMALGASRRDVLALFMRQGLALVLTGTIIGLGGAALITRLLRSLVVDVSAYDPWLFALAPVLLLVVAVVAIGAPALRAARTDPSVALRADS